MSNLPNRQRARHARRTMLMIVAVIALAACGTTAKSTSAPGFDSALPVCPIQALDGIAGPIDLVVWHTQQAKSLSTMQELANVYNASQSKVKVHLEAQGTSYPELMRKFQSAVPSKQLPGLVMFDDTATQTLADSNVIMPAQACINADNYDMSPFLQVARNYYTINGVLWPVSANLGNVLLYFNKGQFRKAGLDPNHPPQTLAEVRDAAQKLKASAGVEHPLVQEMSSWKTEFWMTGARATLVNNDNGRGGAKTDAGNITGNDPLIGLWQWFTDMKSDGLMQAVPATEGQINQYLAMANQQASMLVDSSSAATSVESFLQGNGTGIAGLDQPKPDDTLDIGASVFPGIDDSAGNRTQMGGAAWYMTNTGTPEVQAASWDFAKFMNSPESQAQMLIGGSYLPYLDAAASLPQSQAFFDASLSGRWLKIAYDQVKQIDPSFPGPLIGPYDEFRTAIGEAQDQMMFNGMDLQNATTQAQSQIDAAIKRYNSENF